MTRRQNAPVKLDLAARPRRETTLSLKATAVRVHLGSSKSANAKLPQHLRRGEWDSARQVCLGI